MFGLFAFTVTASYSDSGVTKETVSDQVTLDQDLSVEAFFSMEIEKGVFNLNSPYLGKAVEPKTFLSARSLKGFYKADHAPPDSRMSKIRDNYNKKIRA
jgi:hypothetical protein